MEAVGHSIKDNPRQSIRGLAKGFGCAESTMRHLVHKDLGMTSSTRGQHQPEEADEGTCNVPLFVLFPTRERLVVELLLLFTRYPVTRICQRDSFRARWWCSE